MLRINGKDLGFSSTDNSDDSECDDTYSETRDQTSSHKEHQLIKSSPIPSFSNSSASKMLLVSLLEKFCSLYSQRPDRNKRLYYLLCHRLVMLGILDRDMIIKSEFQSLYTDFFKRLVLESADQLNQEDQAQSTFSIMAPGMLDIKEHIDDPSGHIVDSLSIVNDQHVNYIHDLNASKYLTTLDIPDRAAAISLFKPYSRFQDDFIPSDCLGKGAFGSVWKALNKLDGIEYAIKRIYLKGLSKLSGAFFREVKSLASLEHLNIVRYYSAWIEPCNQMESVSSESEPSETFSERDSNDTFKSPCFIVLYIQMQLCCGTLKEWLKVRNDFIFSGNVPKLDSKERFAKLVCEKSVICNSITDKDNIINNKRSINHKESLRLFRHIVDGLHYIHSSGMMHRDLKPQNILFVLSGNELVPKIGDFGLVKKYQEHCENQNDSHSLNKIYDYPSKEHASLHTTGIGTIGYSSPEQQMDQNYNEKIDIYSLGIILFELMYPFYSEMERITVLSKLRSDNPELPVDFTQMFPNESKLILQMVQSDPSTRPTTQDIIRSPLLDISGLSEILTHLEAQLMEKDREIEELKEIIMKQQQSINN